MEPKKKRPRSKRGKYVNWSNPNWEPILHLARIYVDEFMWVCEIELKGGKRLQAYKHYWTRQYLYLDDEANAFAYRGDDLYRKVPEEELHELFDRVIRRPDPSLPIRERFETENGWVPSEGATSEEDSDSGELPTVPF
jgi:hypothetical protein